MRVLRRGDRGEQVKVLQEFLHLAQDGIFGAITEEAVRQFQRDNGLWVDGVVGADTWNKINWIKSLSSTVIKSSRMIKEIIVHCTATPEGRDVTVSEITKWHQQRGFQTIGYHYVIYRDGSIHTGRNVNLVGAHCTSHNVNSVGVCYVGGCANDGKLTPKDTRTPAQKASLLKLLKQLRAMYPHAKIYGHRDFATKACPSFDAKEEYKNI